MRMLAPYVFGMLFAAVVGMYVVQAINTWLVLSVASL